MAADRVYLCGGADCRERSAAWKKLRDALRDGGDVEVVGCQKICKGPVVGVPIDDRVEWFAKIRGKDLRADVLRLVKTGDVPKGLRGLRSKKRSGKHR